MLDGGLGILARLLVMGQRRSWSEANNGPSVEISETKFQFALGLSRWPKHPFNRVGIGPLLLGIIIWFPHDWMVLEAQGDEEPKSLLQLPPQWRWKEKKWPSMSEQLLDCPFQREHSNWLRRRIWDLWLWRGRLGRRKKNEEREQERERLLEHWWEWWRCNSL